MGRNKGSLNKKTLARLEAEKKQDEIMKPSDVAIREEISAELKTPATETITETKQEEVKIN